MNIAPILQSVNVNTSLIINSTKINRISFSDLLSDNKADFNQLSVDQGVIHCDQPSLKQLTEGLILFLEENAIDPVALENHQELPKFDGESQMVSVVVNEIDNIVSESIPFKDLINQVNLLPIGIGVLTLVKKLEDIAIGTNLDFTPFQFQLNNILDKEYPSYDNRESNQLVSMISAIDKMTSNDKDILKAQIILNQWISSDDAKSLLNFEKLIEINNKLIDTNVLPIHEAEMKINILNHLLEHSPNDELETSVKSVLGKVDFTTLKSIFEKAVKNLLNEDSSFTLLDQFVAPERIMTVDIKKVLKKESLKNAIQIGNDKPINASPTYAFVEKEIKPESTPKKHVETTSNQYDQLFHLSEEIVYTLQSEIALLTEKTGIDFTNVVTEVMKQLKLNLNSLNENKTHGESFPYINTGEKNTNKNVLGMYRSNVMQGLIKESPIISALLNIGKTGEQVAKELAVDELKVFDEINKLVKEKEYHGQLLSKESSISLDSNQKEKIQQIAPLSKGVQQILKGVEFLSSQFSMDNSHIISEIESNLQAALFEYKKLNYKGLFFENIPTLYKSLLDKLAKETQVVSEQQSFQTLGENEQVATKSSILDGLNRKLDAVGNTQNPPRQQLINLTFSQLQTKESAKNEEVREVPFPIQLDKLIFKQPATFIENHKTDSTVRQDFVNQFVNGFKSSKIVQLKNGANRLVIKLNPEHLGLLSVKLEHRNGEMIAKIMTSTNSAKDLLEHSLSQLRQALPSIQIEIERFEISTEQPFKTLKDNFDQKEKNEQQNNDSKSEDEKDNEDSFIDTLLETLNTTS